MHCQSVALKHPKIDLEQTRKRKIDHVLDYITPFTSSEDSIEHLDKKLTEDVCKSTNSSSYFVYYTMFDSRKSLALSLNTSATSTRIFSTASLITAPEAQKSVFDPFFARGMTGRIDIHEPQTKYVLKHFSTLVQKLYDHFKTGKKLELNECELEIWNEPMRLAKLMARKSWFKSTTRGIFRVIDNSISRAIYKSSSSGGCNACKLSAKTHPKYYRFVVNYIPQLKLMMSNFDFNCITQPDQYSTETYSIEVGVDCETTLTYYVFLSNYCRRLATVCYNESRKPKMTDSFIKDEFNYFSRLIKNCENHGTWTS